LIDIGKGFPRALLPGARGGMVKCRVPRLTDPRPCPVQ